MAHDDMLQSALESTKEDLFHGLDVLLEVGQQGQDPAGAQRLAMARLLLIQAVRQLEGNVGAAQVPVDAWRMPIPEVPSPPQLVDLLARCQNGPGRSGDLCRRLLFGPELYRLFTGDAFEPEPDEVLAWLRWLRDEVPHLLGWGEAAARMAMQGPDILIELQLDALLLHDDWTHPSQILPRPRPSLASLFEACIARMKKTKGPGWQDLYAVREKLERTLQIEETARRRRRARRARQKESSVDPSEAP